MEHKVGGGKLGGIRGREVECRSAPPSLVFFFDFQVAESCAGGWAGVELSLFPGGKRVQGLPPTWSLGEGALPAPLSEAGFEPSVSPRSQGPGHPCQGHW